MSLTTVPRYRWRARRYPWAERAIAQAEAIHGEPRPACACGQLLEFCGDRVFSCPACVAGAGRSTPPPALWLSRCDDCGYLLDAATAQKLCAARCTCPEAST